MEPEFIIIHCSATKDSGTVSWGAIRKYHVETNGWKSIGYHWGLELVGNDYEILMGRFPYEQGAHCLGYNDRSVGICLIGDFDTDTPNETQLKKLYSLVNWLQLIYKIPDLHILGHYETENAHGKTCPGKNMWPIIEGMKRGEHWKHLSGGHG